MKFKKIGSILGWFFGVLFGIMGIGGLSSGHIFSAIVLFVLSIIIIPPISNFIKRNWLSTKIKALLIIVLVIIFFITMDTESSTMADNNSTVIQEDEVETSPTSNVVPEVQADKSKDISKSNQEIKISDYKELLESYKSSIEETNDITKKYWDKDKKYSVFDLNLEDLNKVQEIENSINTELSDYLNSISKKDKNYDYISESLESSISSLEKINLAIETIRPLKYIKIGDIKEDTWDSDPEIDGFILDVRFFSDPEETIRVKGKMVVSLFTGVTEWGEPNIRGPLQEQWEKEFDINNFGFGTCGEKKCGFIENLKFEYTKEHTFKKLDAPGIEIKVIDEKGNYFFAEKKAW